MMNRDLNIWSVQKLPTSEDDRGSLSVLEVGKELSEAVCQICWISQFTIGAEVPISLTGRHAKSVVALTGELDVQCMDTKLHLESPSQVIHLSSEEDEELVVFKSISENTSALMLEEGSSLFRENVNVKENSLHKDQDNSLKTINDCNLINFSSQMLDGIGDVILMKVDEEVPFPINRVFYIYDVPDGVERGLHAHKYCHVILVALKGSFEVELDDGKNRKTIRLDNPKQGLHIPPSIWSVQKNYARGTICLALASHLYAQDEYISSYQEFKKYRKG